MVNNNIFFEFHPTSKVLDRPGPPRGPIETCDMDKTCITLSWNPSSEDGGSRITHYVVEKRDTKRSSWARVTQRISDTTCTITNLIERTEYAFRIIAVNKIGESEPLEGTESILIKSKYGESEACL